MVRENRRNGVHAIRYEKLPPEFKLSGPQSSESAEAQQPLHKPVDVPPSPGPRGRSEELGVSSRSC